MASFEEFGKSDEMNIRKSDHYERLGKKRFKNTLKNLELARNKKIYLSF